MSRYSTNDISFTQIADMYLAELRKGVPLSIDVLAKTFPHLADEIRESLPAMVLLEKSFADQKQTPVALPEEIIGGCRIVREIGRGAMGIVYEAVQLSVGRTVAIKVIPLTATSRGAVERFELEARAMGRVEHPNIVSVYDFGCDDKRAYMIMKLIEGCSLRELLDGQTDYKLQFQINELRSNWDVLAHAACDIASAMQHAHEHGMVHRDIKPANLLLDYSGKLWITDFGLAKLQDRPSELSSTGDAIGTPRYMAPEQLRGLCDARSDIYSLGLTLHELVSGRHVWEELSNLSIVTQRDALPITPIGEMCQAIPSSLARIIMKCCEFAPDERYQTAGELQVVLRRFLDGKPKSDRRVRKREPDAVFQKKSRQTMMIASFGVGALSIAAGVAVALFSRPPAETAQMPAPASPVHRQGVTVSSVELLDELANSDSDNMLEIVTGHLEGAIQESSNNLHFSEPAKRKLTQEVDRITSKIRQDGGVSEEALNDLLRAYRKTSLPAATRVMRLTIVVEQSRLPDVEKQAAIYTLQKFATAVANRAISIEESEAISRSLLRGEPTADELRRLFVPDDYLRGWLWELNGRLSSLPPEAFNFADGLSKEMQEVERGLSSGMTKSRAGK